MLYDKKLLDVNALMVMAFSLAAVEGGKSSSLWVGKEQ